MRHLGDRTNKNSRQHSLLRPHRLALLGLTLALAACSSDSDDTPPPPPPLPTAVSGQVLMLNGDNSLVRCEANNNGFLTLCNAAMVEELDGPGSIEVHGTRVYLSDLSDQAVSHCPLGGPQILQNCENTADGSFNSPLGLAVWDEQLFVVQGDNTLAICALNAGAVGACVTQDADGLLRNPTGVAAANATVYVANQHDDSIVICETSKAELGSCSRFTGEQGLFDSPTGIAFANARLYITNVGDDSIVTCTTGEDRTLDDCQKFTDIESLSTPIDLALNGNLAYVANLGNHTLATCKLDVEGAVASCEAGVADDLFMYPGGVAFAPAAQ